MTTLDTTWPAVLAWRLERQFVSTPGPDPVSVARRLCGIQAQVASAAELAIAVRLGAAPRGDVGRALWQDRTLIKTWLMRGTLHLIPAGELPAYCGALGSLRFWEKGSWLRGHGVTAAEVDAIIDAVPRALREGPLTREELTEAIIELTGDGHLREALTSGWGVLLKPLSFLGQLCYGPPREGRVTFASPGIVPLPVQEAGVRLLRAFLGAHGPATPEMFDAWLFRGMARKAVLRGWFEALRPELAEVTVEGRTLFALAEHLDALAAARPVETVHLLPGFDQYILGAPRDLAPLLPTEARAKVSRTAGWISPVVVYRGRVAGVWEAKSGRPVFDLFEEVPEPLLTPAADRISALLAQ
ncbi:winged helix DNA-binding domain-containing protein [Spongiactinospora sp. TRM90649]|uniref:winged helix DNA-binding domain-containing protein n=1 Tax=Spongiactinospora sp. TRM90649 TaxID=3031114 RepID=UPI0023F7B882|nr:winged helix DNA-binding domain-containing protein [Spongiactinospora sp. TRM90649]MDF5755381.1 winged helix DNA-binding domain-containing protein [Spongiactinospora sp. TRM90649]